MKRYLVGLLLLGTAVSVVAAPKPTQAGKSTSQPEARAKGTPKPGLAAVQPFSLDVLDKGVIPPQYAGMPIRTIFEALEKRTQLAKGEFESSADFNQRQKTALESALIGQVHVSDILAFVIPVQKKSYSEPFYYTYDADNGEALLTMSANRKTFNNIGSPNYSIQSERLRYDSYEIKSDSAPTEKYAASNAYGATVNVTKFDSTNYTFATFGSGGYSLKVQMDAKRAASELPTLKALLLVKLREPYAAYDYFHADPTRDTPTEIIEHTKSLVGDVLGVVFYSGRSGEIVAKSPGMRPATESVAESR